MKNYRKNFIILNMGLICFVLIVTFSFIGFEIYQSEYFNLKNTMSLVVKPWNINAVRSEKDNPKSSGILNVTEDGKCNIMMKK